MGNEDNSWANLKANAMWDSITLGSPTTLSVQQGQTTNPYTNLGVSGLGNQIYPSQYPGAVYNTPTPHTYVPPEEFQKQVVELIKLLVEYGPKLRLLADVLGAMNIEEEDKIK